MEVKWHMVLSGTFLRHFRGVFSALLPALIFCFASSALAQSFSDSEEFNNIIESLANELASRPEMTPDEVILHFFEQNFFTLTPLAMIHLDSASNGEGLDALQSNDKTPSAPESEYPTTIDENDKRIRIRQCFRAKEGGGEICIIITYRKSDGRIHFKIKGLVLFDLDYFLHCDEVGNCVLKTKFGTIMCQGGFNDNLQWVVDCDYKFFDFAIKNTVKVWVNEAGNFCIQVDDGMVKCVKPSTLDPNDPVVPVIPQIFPWFPFPDNWGQPQPDPAPEEK
jgi:hypothetical protein